MPKSLDIFQAFVSLILKLNEFVTRYYCRLISKNSRKCLQKFSTTKRLFHLFFSLFPTFILLRHENPENIKVIPRFLPQRWKIPQQEIPESIYPRRYSILAPVLCIFQLLRDLPENCHCVHFPVKSFQSKTKNKTQDELHRNFCRRLPRDLRVRSSTCFGKHFQRTRQWVQRRKGTFFF